MESNKQGHKTMLGNGWGWVVAQLWGLVLNVMVNKKMM